MKFLLEKWYIIAVKDQICKKVDNHRNLSRQMEVNSIRGTEVRLNGESSNMEYCLINI